MDKTIDRWTDPDGNGYAFKDTVARAQNRATIDKMNAETADSKSELDIERKRIDNLIATGTAQTQEIGKTIVQTKLGSSDMNMDYLAADKYYSGLFNGITFKDTDFFYIPSPSGSGAEYVGKLLKPGLYHMEFCVKISKDGGLPEIAMRIILKKGSTTTGEYSELKTEYIIFPQTSSSTNMRNVEYIFAITEPTYIKLFVTSIVDGTGTFGFNASECTITAIDWKGKQSADLSELHDLRIGADGQIYKTAGEAVRKQFEMILKNCSGLQEFSRDTSGQISEHILGFANLVKLSKIESKDGFKVYQSENERNKILIVNETATGENTWEIADCMVCKSEENSNEERLISGGTYNIFGVNSDTTIKFYDDSGEMIGNEVNCNYTIQEFTIPSNCTRLKIYVHLINPETFLNIFVCNYRKTIQEQINDISAKIDTMQEIITKLVTAPQLVASENNRLQIRYGKEE